MVLGEVEVGADGLVTRLVDCSDHQTCLEAELWSYRMKTLTLAAERDNATVGVWWREVRIQLHLRREVVQLDTLRVEKGSSGRRFHRVS